MSRKTVFTISGRSISRPVALHRIARLLCMQYTVKVADLMGGDDAEEGYVAPAAARGDVASEAEGAGDA